MASADYRSGDYPETRVNVQRSPDIDVRLKARGGWVGAHLQAQVFWPNEPHVVGFEQQELLILPAKDELLPAIFLRNPDLTTEAARATILRFLSAWSWNEGRAASVLSWTGGSHAHRSQRYDPKTRTRYFDFDYLAENLPKRTALALAFFREGLSLDHVAYSFLSFYKIIDLMHKGQSAQKKWIKEAVPKILDEKAQKRLAELAPALKGSSIQDYMYSSCRCAVAHASVQAVDPDNPIDEQRLRRDLPVIEALARHIIACELGIPTQDDIWKSRTRRIAGARWMIGDRIRCQLEAGSIVSRRAISLPRKVDIKTRGKPQHALLRGLEMRVLEAAEGWVHLSVESTDGLFQFLCSIDFVGGEIGFDLLNGVDRIDDGSVLAMERAIQVDEWLAELFCNGRLQLLEAETDLLIAESKAVIPQNMFFSPKGHEEGQKRLQAELDRRKQLQREPKTQ